MSNRSLRQRIKDLEALIDTGEKELVTTSGKLANEDKIEKRKEQLRQYKPIGKKSNVTKKVQMLENIAKLERSRLTSEPGKNTLPVIRERKMNQDEKRELKDKMDVLASIDMYLAKNRSAVEGTQLSMQEADEKTAAYANTLNSVGTLKQSIGTFQDFTQSDADDIVQVVIPLLNKLKIADSLQNKLKEAAVALSSGKQEFLTSSQKKAIDDIVNKLRDIESSIKIESVKENDKLRMLQVKNDVLPNVIAGLTRIVDLFDEERKRDKQAKVFSDKIESVVEAIVDLKELGDGLRKIMQDINLGQDINSVQFNEAVQRFDLLAKDIAKDIKNLNPSQKGEMKTAIDLYENVNNLVEKDYRTLMAGTPLSKRSNIHEDGTISDDDTIDATSILQDRFLNLNMPNARQSLSSSTAQRTPLRVAVKEKQDDNDSDDGDDDDRVTTKNEVRKAVANISKKYNKTYNAEGFKPGFYLNLKTGNWVKTVRKNYESSVEFGIPVAKPKRKKAPRQITKDDFNLRAPANFGKDDFDLRAPANFGNGFGEKQEIKVGQNGQFGKLKFDMNKFAKMQLHVKKGRKLIAKGPMSYDLMMLLTKRYNPRYNYSQESLDVFKKLVSLAEFNTMSGNGMKKKIARGESKGTKKNKKMKTKMIYVDNLDELVERMYVLFGSVESGNNNPEVLEELMSLMAMLKSKGVLSVGQYTELMNSL